jgi:tetratricopeptide (TPR) repeat protein
VNDTINGVSEGDVRSKMQHADRITPILQRMLSTPPGTSAYVSVLIDCGDDLAEFDSALARRTFEEACVVAEAIKDARLLSKALSRLAWQLSVAGRLNLALIRANHAKIVAESIGSVELVCNAKHVIAWIRGRVGDTESAIQTWNELIRAARILNDLEREADYETNLGILQGDADDFVAAVETQMRAFELYRQLDDHPLHMSANNVAFAMIRNSRGSEAIVWANRALNACPATENVNRAHILHTLGACHLADSSHDFARDIFKRAVSELGKDNNDVRLACLLELDSGRLERAVNDIPAAITHLERALSIATTSSDTPPTRRSAHLKRRSSIARSQTAHCYGAKRLRLPCASKSCARRKNWCTCALNGSAMCSLRTTLLFESGGC